MKQNVANDPRCCLWDAKVGDSGAFAVQYKVMCNLDRRFPILLNLCFLLWQSHGNNSVPLFKIPYAQKGFGK